MAWPGPPSSWLKTRFNANEILTSLMLTYVAQLILIYLVTGPWRLSAFPNPAVFGNAGTMPMIQGTRLHLGVPIALMVTVAAWVLLRMHCGWGFSSRSWAKRRAPPGMPLQR